MSQYTSDKNNKNSQNTIPLALALPMHGAVIGIEWVFLDGFFAYNNRLFVVCIFMISVAHIAALGYKRHLYFKEHGIKNPVSKVLLHIFLMALYVFVVTAVTELFFF